MAEPLYVLRFRYVKPAKTLIKLEQKLAQIFLYTPNSSEKKRKRNKRSSPVLNARVPLKIFRNFLLETGWDEKDGIFFTSKEEPYYRAIVFASVLQCTRNRHSMDEMYTLVKNMPYIDIKFWSKVFIEAFESRNRRRDLYKPVRALKEVYGYV